MGQGYGTAVLFLLVGCDPASDDAVTFGDPEPIRQVGARTLGDAPIKYTGEAAGDAAGSSSAAADLDGDGVADWVIGARGANAGAGAVFLVRGPATGGSLADADLVVSDAHTAELGWSVAAIPDLDGDGTGEILAGAPSTSDHAGEAWWLPGTLNGAAGGGDAVARFVGSERSEAGVRVGYSGDGWFVSAWLDPAAGAQAGAIYLFDVRAGSLGPADAVASRSGENAEDWSAYGAAMGDVSGDGMFDLLVGADGSDRTAEDAGAAYYEVGPIEGHRSLSGAPTAFSGLAERDFAGHSVAIAGDVFGSGTDAILFGALGVGEDDREGAVYGYATVPLGDFAAGDQGFTLAGPADDTIFGYSLAGAGDVDGDGFEDVLVGARYDSAGGDHAGATWLVYGPLDSEVALATAVRFMGEAAQDDAVYNVGGTADVDGDGAAELLFGAMGNDAGGEDAGAVYGWALPMGESVE